ncbi:MAG TPA: serine/threonine-protein kinase [Ktedonosporobacter sp.]|nr:serine/threonine-protein kinase [Ktedonosporobacter sp.]
MEQDSLIGQQVGTYLIQSRLGEGGMARVYKAYHTRLRREVAMKVISEQVANQTDFQIRFEREAQLIASLEHSNIVAVYDFGEIGARTYLTMQYVGGGSLRDQLRPGQPLEVSRAARYMLQMARALHHAHLRGIVHRDVKPQNMLVSANDPNHLLLSDFGIAKLFDNSDRPDGIAPLSGASPVDPMLTSADQIVGTAGYMAPEQILRKPVDARTDVYALGVVLYLLLTGQALFQVSVMRDLFYHHLYISPVPVGELNSDIPEELSQITMKALEKTPERRFQSTELLAQALDAVTARITRPLDAPTFDQDTTRVRFPSNITSASVRSPLSTSSLPGQTPVLAQLSSQEPVEGMAATPLNTPTHSTPAGLALPTPVGPGPVAPLNVKMSMVLACILFVIVLVVTKVFPLPGSNARLPASPITTATTAKAFVEGFHDNSRNWLEGDLNGLHAVIAHNTYTLTTDKTNTTYFPYPGTVGPLPANFTLTVQITQDAGATNSAYGLVFYLTANGNQGKSCYAFIIESNGIYATLRYDPNTPVPAVLWQGQLSAIQGLHHSNTLQASIRDDGFQFIINGQRVSQKSGVTLRDQTYSTGLSGLLVAGPDTGFSVTHVTLATP